MYIAAGVIAFFLVLTLSYFVLDNAVKNEHEGMKVFGAIIFTFLLVISLAVLFGGFWFELGNFDPFGFGR